MKMYKVTVLEGDGIGPEITREAVRVLKAAAEKYNFNIDFDYALLGGAAIDAVGTPLPEDTVKRCKASDAVLLGAVGGPKWDNLSGDMRPEAGLLGIRKALGLYANLRPSKVFKPLKNASPLKLGDTACFDVMIVRELTGGIYFGKRGRFERDGVACAFDTEEYSQPEIERIAEIAFELAMSRNGRLCSVDKANVLESSRFWRETVLRVSEKYPEVELSHLYVDNCAMQLVKAPWQFDVIVTSNLFGDILSDEAAMISGSIGMLPSASLSSGSFGLYEPVHGSAPDIAGTGKANPLATILSAAMLLKISLKQEAAAAAVEGAVDAVLSQMRTPDIYEDGLRKAGTCEMTDAVISLI
ncbi:MAG: 3-isopropylmalate dehydrogenase [Clostridiales bacterium]|nr:3-isopropylmalate dehydrogenase [Clostridiales bacterium]